MQFTPNAPLVNPADLNLMQSGGIYNQFIPGMNMDVMRQAQMMPNQMPNSMTMPQNGQSQMDAYKMMAQGIQGMGRNMQQGMPSGNTAQIMRDQSRPQFAGYVGSPQQQMAQALRNR